jgi:hypothetical protein
VDWLRWLGRLPTSAAPAPRAAGVLGGYGRMNELPDGAVIGAGFWPGFAPDLTCWRVIVSGSGCVRQEVLPWIPRQREPDEIVLEDDSLGPERAAALVAAAEVAGLRDMAARYDSYCLDLETISVAARLPGGVRSVVVDGPWLLAGRGHLAAVAVLGLWVAVQRVAPWQPEWWQWHDQTAG